MDLFSELVTAVQVDLNVGDESTLFSPTTIKLAINRAYRKSGALFPWPQLMDAKQTTTQTDQEYYDYPQIWRSNSIWKLTVDSVRYGEPPDGSPLSFDDYELWKEDYPDATDKKWSNQWRRYFIEPAPTVAGLTICIWGIKNTTTLTENSDETIFSYNSVENNEAVVLEAVAILKSQGEQEKAGEFRSAEAKLVLAASWGKIRAENAKYEKDLPMFSVPDYYGDRSSENLTGKFNRIV